MAEQSLTTPGAVSRRFLFSAVVALPVATATAGSLPGGVSPKLLALLERYRDTCIRLREVEADHAERLLSIPASFRPGSSDGRCVSRWPEWTRAELDALGLPPGMPSRPSQDDFLRFFNRTSSPDPQKREEARQRHKVRIDAWHARRAVQKEWFAKAGLDVVGRQRSRLLDDKHSIECELMNLMTGPDKTAIDA
jgi:hypothetical protein